MAIIASTNITTNTGFSASPGNVVKTLQNVVDVATMISVDGVTPDSMDTIEMIEIPVGATVLAAGIEVITAESGNPTAQVELGDSADFNRYVLTATVSSTGHVSTQIQANVPFFYATADTINLLSSIVALTNVKLRVWAVVSMSLSPNNTADLNTWA